MDPACVRELHQTGIPLGKEVIKKLKSQLTQKLANMRGAIKRELSTTADITDPKTLIQCMYDKGYKPESLSKEFFKEHRQENDLYETMYQYYKLLQLVTLVSNIVHKISDDDRLRGEWIYDSSLTQRLSCRNPNLTALPKCVSDLVMSESGYSVIKADYSQIELKILAELTQDPEFLRALAEEDVHAATAATIFGKTAEEVTEQERKACKAINYGVLYGCSAYGLQQSIEQLGVSCSLGEASTFRNRFFEIHPNVREYQKMCCESDTLVSLGGSKIDRSRLKPTQALNWPIQTSCSEIQKRALSLVMDRKQESTRLINAIHDEIWIECPSKDADSEASMLLQAMKDAYEHHIKTVPFKADIEYFHGGN